MTSQPEKFFRDKLENYQRPAPAAAWDRIEAGLDKTQNKKLWLKIAATLLLLAVAGFVLWPDTATQETIPMATNKTKTTVPQQKTEKKTNTPVQAPVVAEQKQKSAQHKKIENLKQDEMVIPRQDQPTTPEQNFVVEPVQPTASVAVAEVAPVQESKVIVYTADEVNARFMRKKVPAQATDEEKKASGIQKLMGLAYNLKNNENGLSDLRQKKDEILALNFLNNEDKTEKRNN